LIKEWPAIKYFDEVRASCHALYIPLSCKKWLLLNELQAGLWSQNSNVWLQIQESKNVGSSSNLQTKCGEPIFYHGWQASK